MRPRQKKGPRPAIAQRLRAARETRGLTQIAAARELGIADTTLASWESGTRRPSTLARRYLEAWAAACLGERYAIIPEETK